MCVIPGGRVTFFALHSSCADATCGGLEGINQEKNNDEKMLNTLK